MISVADLLSVAGLLTLALLSAWCLAMILPVVLYNDTAIGRWLVRDDVERELALLTLAYPNRLRRQTVAGEESWEACSDLGLHTSPQRHWLAWRTAHIRQCVALRCIVEKPTRAEALDWLDEEKRRWFERHGSTRC